jgi:hypothetical protein
MYIKVLLCTGRKTENIDEETVVNFKCRAKQSEFMAGQSHMIEKIEYTYMLSHAEVSKFHNSNAVHKYVGSLNISGKNSTNPLSTLTLIIVSP